MSEIESINELKKILGMQMDSVRSPVKQHNNVSKTSNTSNYNREPTKRREMQQHAKANGQQDAEPIDDKSLVIKIPNAQMFRQKRPESPVSIVSISDDSDTEQNELSPILCDEVDIEF